jgi:serine/threonine protein kinase
MFISRYVIDLTPVQPNILVDDSGRVRVTDFGLATILQGSAPQRSLLDDHNARWTAPEILYDSGMYSKEADIFSFAMVIIEVRYGGITIGRALVYCRFALTQVFTGAAPFNKRPLTSAVMAIMGGDRPPRPTNPVCSDELWAMIQRCWNQKPHLRPEVSEVLQALPGGAPKNLMRLHTHGMASQEFRRALAQFYCGTGYEDCIDSLNDADGREFADFLYRVGQLSNLSRPNLCVDSWLRCYGPRG